MYSRAKYLLLDQNIQGQMIRFALTGGFITASGAASYWFLAQKLSVNPYLAMTIVYAAFMIIAYLLHSNISFFGYGARDKIVYRSARFFITNLISWAINQFFVWLLIEYAQGPSWWPVLPFIFVTPVMSFILTRAWVFRQT